MSTDVSSVIKHFPSAEGGFSTVTSGLVSSGSATVGLTDTTGYANGEVVVFIIDPTDPIKKQVFTGVMDTGGSQVTGVIWTTGTNQDHASGATIVDYATATHISMVSKGMLVEHDQDGTHSDITGNSANFTSSVSTDTIAEHTAAAGVTVDGMKIKDSKVQTADALSPVYTTIPYKFSAYRNAAFTIGNNGYVKVTYDTELYDTGSNFASGTFTAPVNGFYQFSAQVGMDTVSGSGTNITLWKNGVLFRMGRSGVEGSGFNGAFSTIAGICTTIQLTAGDTIDFYHYGQGQAGHPNAAETWADGRLVSTT